MGSSRPSPYYNQPYVHASLNFPSSSINHDNLNNNNNNGNVSMVSTHRSIRTPHLNFNMHHLIRERRNYSVEYTRSNLYNNNNNNNNVDGHNNNNNNDNNDNNDNKFVGEGVHNLNIKKGSNIPYYRINMTGMQDR